MTVAAGMAINAADGSCDIVSPDNDDKSEVLIPPIISHFIRIN